MKRIISGIIALCIVLTCASAPAYAEPQELHCGYKLFRGISNTGLCLLELWRTMYITTEKHNPYVGWTKGLWRGTGRSFKRAGVGLLELFTFPFSYPRETDEPLMQPEYVWQGWEDPSVE